MRAALLTLTVLPAILLAEPDPEIAGLPLSAEQIVAQALETVAAQPASFQHVAVHTKRTLHLSPSGDVTDRHWDVYRVRPVEGEAFYELVERNGRPATARDLEDEARQRERFRESFDSESEPAPDAGLAFSLTRSLLERYAFTLAGRHPANGWELAFEPKTDAPPATRRIDQVLNRLEGTLWIDPDDFGLTRAEFSLQQPMRIWGGLFGSLTRFDGRFEQVRLGPGRWLPGELKLEMDGWAPFHSMRRRVELDWSDYAPAR